VHNNYYFLRQLTRTLAAQVTGGVISQCFSQHADELILQLETPEGAVFIRASVQPRFCCLSLPSDYRRARKNSIDLFPEIIGSRVVSVTQFLNDRSLSLNLNDSHSLLFKLHGHQANVILLDGPMPVKVFRNHIVQDLQLSPDKLNKPIDFSKEAFFKNQHSLERSYFTFGRPVWEYLASQHFYEKSVEERWNLFIRLVALLKEPAYYLLRKNEEVVLSLLPGKEIIATYPNPVAAINDFFSVYHATRALVTEKQQAIHLLHTRLNQAREYIQRNTLKLEELKNDNRFSMWADLLMANLSTLQGGEDAVVLPNFYRNNLPEKIKLKRELSIQKNAEIYYRKARNRALEITWLTEALAGKQQQVTTFQDQLSQLQQASQLQDVRKLTEAFGLTGVEKEKETLLPYREVEFGGFKIWIGKNAKANDALTQNYSYKEDLWLHAKDVAGSHVLIKYQAGKPFPKPVIERAAQLAAYHSKRKTESLCPVTVTPKKYVRKRKGDPPGMVVVEKERVLLVKPAGP
jgi:predicted ribosome quality control (RQC) complex YloA/Tae2 family protein